MPAASAGSTTACRMLRYAARTLWKTPGYAAVAILTLGLGIGANAAIFSVVNGVLFTPLPYANGQRLMILSHAAPLANQQNFGVSIKELYDYREQLGAVDGLVEFHQMNFDLLRRGEPDRVATGVVSHNFFDVLGIRPLLGRTFADADDDEGAEAVLVLGYDYWVTRFGGRSRHRRPGVPDERPAAHGGRRDAGRAALSQQRGRLHADLGVPVPLGRGAQHRRQPPRLLRPAGVRAAQARRLVRRRRRPRWQRSRSGSSRTSRTSTAPKPGSRRAPPRCWLRSP